mgnify:CR=1 FL=1
MAQTAKNGPMTGLLARLARTRAAVRAAIVVERLWPLVLPLAVVSSLFASLSWLGVFRAVPDWARLALAAALALAALACLYPLRFFRAPAPAEIDRRIERANRLEHAPLHAQTDRPAAGDAFAQALWREHQKRMAARLDRLGGDLPHARLPERDPWGLRAAAAPVITAFAIGVLAVAVLNPIVAATSRQAEQLSVDLVPERGSILSVSREGLWLRQANPDGQTVIRALRANQDGTELHAVTFIAFDAAGLPVTRIEAASARLSPGRWHLSDARQWRLTETNPEQSVRHLPQTELATDLDAGKIRDSFGKPSAIPIWDLPAFIDSLDRAGFSAQKHRVWLQTELAMPLLLAAMVLMAAGFTMRHVRFGRSGVMVLAALLAGFAIFFLRNFAQVLGENGQIPVLLAAWSPPLAAIMLALGLLLHLEDG